MSPGSTKKKPVKKSAETEAMLKEIDALNEGWRLLKIKFADLGAEVKVLSKEVESMRTSKWHMRSIKHAD